MVSRHRLLRAALLVTALFAADCSRTALSDSTGIPAPASDAGTPSCAAAGGTLCGNACVSLMTDDANCGACGRACEPGAGCAGGVCQRVSCPAPYEICDGVCTDVPDDPDDCGACGVACPTWNGCANGQCVPLCPFVTSRTTVSSNPRVEPWLVAAGDFDGDGAPDLAVGGTYTTPDQRTLGEVDVLFNRGGGSFAGPAETTLPLQENLCGLLAAPFQETGSMDLAACAYDHPVEIFRDESGTFAAGPPLAGAPGPQAIASADFNGDGRPDMVAVETDFSCCGGPGAALVTLLEQADGSFRAVSLPQNSDELPMLLLAGDVNGDGHPDLVGLLSTPELRVYLGRGDGSFVALPSAKLSAPARNGALADVDGDGRTDLVLALEDGTVQIFAGDGAGRFTAGAQIPAGPQPMGVVVTDFNGDGQQDVAVADYDSGAIAIFPGLGGGKLGAPALCTAGLDTQSLVSSDLDGDGRPDLVTVDRAGTVIVLLYRGHP